eukprot:2886810-Prymnesium_polylepis.1
MCGSGPGRHMATSSRRDAPGLLRTAMMVAFMTCALSVLAAPAGASIEELVTQWGYNISRFRVETLDGCALTVFSVCDFRRESAWRPPVLLQHGFEDSATTW